ncbi:hypothetical protein [Bradyrhizobium sp.]|uniref:hypothetical protein n=1 Tax=Bradyrhizobium sp. TaxID=376 RepID=UPI002606AD1D|nr:hypothetical protein [Bradyrhizobium sp.]
MVPGIVLRTAGGQSILMLAICLPSGSAIGLPAFSTVQGCCAIQSFCCLQKSLFGPAIWPFLAADAARRLAMQAWRDALADVGIDGQTFVVPPPIDDVGASGKGPFTKAAHLSA